MTLNFNFLNQNNKEIIYNGSKLKLPSTDPFECYIYNSECYNKPDYFENIEVIKTTEDHLNASNKIIIIKNQYIPYHFDNNDKLIDQQIHIDDNPRRTFTIKIKKSQYTDLVNKSNTSEFDSQLNKLTPLTPLVLQPIKEQVQLTTPPPLSPIPPQRVLGNLWNPNDIQSTDIIKTL